MTKTYKPSEINIPIPKSICNRTLKIIRAANKERFAVMDLERVEEVGTFHCMTMNEELDRVYKAISYVKIPFTLKYFYYNADKKLCSTYFFKKALRESIAVKL